MSATDYACTREQFLHDVRDHQMNSLLDQGVHRHLRFKRPGCSIYWFDLITAPGILLITGDMGDFTFRRLNDMFAFFRADERGLSINRSYWLEKCEAQDRSSGATEFSAEKLWSWVVSDFRARASRFGDRKWEWWSDLRWAIKNHSGEHECIAAANDLPWGVDWCDAPRLETYTSHFEWCLWAIVWGISVYDAAQSPQAVAA